MDILPLKLLAKEDQNIFGESVINLGVLARFGFPVLPGLALNGTPIVLPLFKSHFSETKEDLLGVATLSFKRDLDKIILSKDLDKELGRGKYFFYQDQFFPNKKQLWDVVKRSWFEEVSSKLKRGELLKNLSSQVILWTDKKGEQVTAYFDPQFEEVVVKSSKKLDPKTLKQIDELVLAADKKLVFEHVYRFLLTCNGEVYLVGLSPYTHNLVNCLPEVVISKNDKKYKLRATVKIFAGTKNRLSNLEEVDGVLLETENYLDFDELALKTIETAQRMGQNPVIFKLPNFEVQGIKGSLGLIHQKKVLQQMVKAFLFCRHKKNLLNLELGIPLLRSADEFLEIKRELAAFGLSRKGSLRFWLEASVPENIINIDGYLDGGLNGVILNLDKLQESLIGFSDEEKRFYIADVKTLLKFIEPIFKPLHRAKVQILVKGYLGLQAEVLDFLVEKGVYGLVVDNPLEVQSLPELFRWVEKRLVTKRLRLS